MKFVTLGRRSVYGALLAASASHGSIAVAQSVTIPVPPTRATVDGNGVDLATGQLRTSDVGLSIGTPGAGGLVHSRSWFSDASGSGWRHQHMMLVKVTNTGKTIVTIGSQSVGFSSAGGGYTADQGEGATLTATATVYTYTSRDGTVITFDRGMVSNNASYYGAASGVATAVVYPTGERLDLAYKRQSYDYTVCATMCNVFTFFGVRLVSVTSSSGYQLKYHYAAATLSAANVDDWYRMTKVTGYNMSVDYCDPVAESCTAAGVSVTYATAAAGANVQETATDALSRATRYTMNSAKRMAAIRRPSSAVDSVTFSYNPDNRIETVSIGSLMWKYAYALNGTTLTTTITDPANHARMTTANNADRKSVV